MEEERGTILCLSIMVKNEEHTIERTLKPFIDNNITHIHIHDTGSTDGTMSVLRNLNIKNLIITNGEFEGYSTTRNNTLMITKSVFYMCPFILMLDAEWITSTKHAKKLIDFLVKNKNTTDDCFLFDIERAGIINQQNRLFRRAGKYHFEDDLHERAIVKGSVKIPEVLFTWAVSADGIKRTKDRIRTQDIPYYLEKEKKKEMTTRDWFYLANSYFVLEDYDNAIKYYTIRKGLGENEEEVFICLYRIGFSYHLQGNWEEALDYYMRAYLFRPTRIESLVKVVQHLKGKAKLLFAKKACSIDIPNDKIFLEKKIYDETRWVELAKAYHQVGKNNKALQTLNKVNNLPEIEGYRRLFREKKIVNLILYSPGYEDYYNKLVLYNSGKIEFYFYMYTLDEILLNGKDINTDMDRHMIYIRGEETRIPGILDKTLKVLELFKEYDYVIRTNATTVCNFPLLKTMLDNVTYGGPLCYGDVKDYDELTTLGYVPDEKVSFVSGTCIVMNKICIDTLLKSDINKELIDDVAIGLALKNNMKITNLHSMCFVKLGIVESCSYRCENNLEMEKAINYIESNVDDDSD